MNYSRRQLEALGETLGECVTRKEGGRVIYGGGGSGGGGGATSTQVSDLPEWAKPYAKETLGKASALTDISQNPYQTYGGERIAGFQPIQQKAQEAAYNMGTAGQLGTGTGLASAAGLMGLGASYQPGVFRNQFRAPEAYQPSQFAMLQAQAPELQQFQMGPAERVGTGSFTQPGAAAQYMSPYIEQALAPQLREAQRASDILGTQQAGQAVQQGAFGGSRAALLEAERQRNLATQMGDIRARGLQSAYEQAQQLYGTEAQRQLAAQQANQQAGLTVGGQNLAALLGVQQLGAGQSMQAQLANQQALQAAQQAAEQSRQFGYGQGMTAAQQRAQFGQAAQQLGEQSRQYGAGYGLQGLGTALQAAGQLGQLGQTEFGQAMDINRLQQQVGAQQQALEQQRLSQNYQDFMNQQRYPYQQLEFMSNILRGTPMGTVQTMYQPGPSAVQNIASLGLGAYGLKQLGMFADGGQVSGYARGGSVTDEDNIEDIVDNLSDAQLAQAKQAAMARGDGVQLQAIAREEAMRASERRGMAGMYNSLPQGVQARMAGGGIVAFNGEGNSLVADDYGFVETEGGLRVVPEDLEQESAGDQNRFGRALDLALDRIQAINAYEPKSYKPEELNQIIEQRFEQEKRLAGNAPYSAFENYLAEAEAGRPQALQQAKGLAALKAASAVLQPGGTMRGLGAAGAAFAGSYNTALQADRAEKRALASMKFNLADAQRKERMGMVRSAQGAASQAVRDRQAAERAHIQKLGLQAQAAGRVAQAAKPTAKAPSEAKLNEQLGAAEIAYENDPTPANLKKVTALRRAVELTKTSEFGPDRLAVLMAGISGQQGIAGLRAEVDALKIDQQIRADINKRLTEAMYSNEYMALKTPEDRKKYIDNLETELLKKARQPIVTAPSTQSRPGAASPRPGADGPITPEAFNAQWAKLKKGESLVGPDGKVYIKQ